VFFWIILENTKHSKNIWEYSGISQNIESIFLDIWGRLNHLSPIFQTYKDIRRKHFKQFEILSKIYMNAVISKGRVTQ